MAWSLEESELAAAIRRLGPAEFDLAGSNPTEAGLVYPQERILSALADARALRYQPDPLGVAAAREAVAEYYQGAVPFERIVLTASTSEAYSWCFKLLCNPGDVVLVPRPSYPLFEFLAHLESVDVRQFPMHYHDGWYVDIDELTRLADERTRAVVFVNPNNPTGSYLRRSEHEAMARLCARLGMALIADEVFCDYALAPLPADRLRSVAGHGETLTFILSGLSKVSALPQMKLGWIAVQGAGSEAAIKRLELIADTFLSTSTPVQRAAAELLAIRGDMQRQILARTRANYGELRARASGGPVRALETQGGWCAIVQPRRIQSECEWVLQLLSQYKVLVQPGYFYDFDSEPFLVLSTLTEPAVFAEGARRTILAGKGQTL
jgi:aspartate/methionine/tyrosine aminotransferase